MALPPPNPNLLGPLTNPPSDGQPAFAEVFFDTMPVLGLARFEQHDVGKLVDLVLTQLQEVEFSSPVAARWKEEGWTLRVVRIGQESHRPLDVSDYLAGQRRVTVQCEKCKIKHKFLRVHTFASRPPILIIHINNTKSLADNTIVKGVVVYPEQIHWQDGTVSELVATSTHNVLCDDVNITTGPAVSFPPSDHYVTVLFYLDTRRLAPGQSRAARPPPNQDPPPPPNQDPPPPPNQDPPPLPNQDPPPPPNQDPPPPPPGQRPMSPLCAQRFGNVPLFHQAIGDLTRSLSAPKRTLAQAATDSGARRADTDILEQLEDILAMNWANPEAAEVTRQICTFLAQLFHQRPWVLDIVNLNSDLDCVNGIWCLPISRVLVTPMDRHFAQVIAILNILEFNVQRGHLRSLRWLYYFLKWLLKHMQECSDLLDVLCARLGLQRKLVNIAALGRGVIVGAGMMILLCNGEKIYTADRVVTHIPYVELIDKIDLEETQIVYVSEKHSVAEMMYDGGLLQKRAIFISPSSEPQLPTHKFLGKLMDDNPWVAIGYLGDVDPLGWLII
ncbi:Spo11/DNA topoisomerase VI subunit A [Roridomyces roridus]|uniref:Spo11/DNA topoisomerase VI subunit A n=1 Tax=Roridomyces roridus TaxID=1738132 RepID=A0AAD7AXC4_9AGAR|nr:Spo11/DNA topoisomerase VI subunit A [Roridomyces roridus]